MVDIVVIGSGWSGLYAAKTCTQMGYSVKIIEQRDRIGGVWNHSLDTKYISSTDFTELTSSQHVTQAYDFSYLPNMSTFPTANEIHNYLTEYAKISSYWIRSSSRRQFRK